MGRSVLLLALLHLVKGQENLALGKKTWQSESLPELEGRRAVDGDFNADLRRKHCTQTSWSGTSDPWWLVDLGDIYHINAVSISNRGDDHHERINGSIILVGNEFEGKAPNLGTYSTCAEISSLAAGKTQKFTCQQALCGRYVSVLLPGKRKILTLCEVQVFANVGRKNLALGAPTWQSTTEGDGVAARAVDGGKNPAMISSTCTHTKQENDPWWIVDLGGMRNVSNVIITNRKDCCYKRLKTAIVSVGNKFDGTTFHSSNFDTCAVIDSVVQDQLINLTCGQVLNGRYLAVSVPGPDKILTMCEIEVFAPDDESMRRPVYCTDTGPWDCTYKSALACQAGPSSQLSFSGTIYHLFNSSRQWKKASAICEQIGGTLAIVTDYAVQERLLAEMWTYQWSGGWIGLEHKSNKWIWKNGEVGNVTWAEGRPAKSGAKCSFLQSNESQGFVAADCSTKITFICQTKDPTAQVKPDDKKRTQDMELHYVVLLSIVGGVVVLFLILIPIIICIRNKDAEEEEEIPPLPKPESTIFILPVTEVNGVEQQKDKRKK